MKTFVFIFIAWFLGYIVDSFTLSSYESEIIIACNACACSAIVAFLLMTATNVRAILMEKSKSVEVEVK